ncbi:MAG TPA: DUF255 domain-containing protein [Anaerolineae bacterium]|nr:DUF255 domain-containing protein [Anaerolineae bacterium]
MKALDQVPEAWRLAMQREKESGEFYARMARSADDEAIRSLFEMLHAQEREHYALLEGEYRRLFEPDLELGKERLPLTWYEWDDDSFRLADALDLPIMLYITAPWCEPCHLMERTTLADPEVIDAINDSVIPILVDADKRPDVDERYARGGWPTAAFLDANGEVIESYNFMTPEEMLVVLDRVRDRFQGAPAPARPTIAARPGVPAIEPEEEPAAAGALSVDVVDTILNRLVATFDEQHGGFRETPKFHRTGALTFILAMAHRTGEPALARVVNKSLEAMAHSSLYDKERGGFFRYAANADWSAPHFEKMADDQANLLKLYLQAYRATGDVSYLDTARGVLRYVDEVLWDRDRGFFYSSQEADPDYYAAGESLDTAQSATYDVPYVDRTVYSARNAAVASAYLLASAVLDEPRYADLAVRALEYVWSQLYKKGLGIHHYYDDQPHLPGLLADQVAMAHAWLDAYEHFGREVYLEYAQTLMRFADNALRDVDGGYFDTLPAPEALGRLRQRTKPFGANVLAADAHLRLGRLTGRDDHRLAAQATLEALLPHWPAAGYEAARFALTVDRLLRRPLLVTVVGENEDPRRDALIRAARRTYAPNKTVQAVDPRWEFDRLERLGYPSAPSPAAYVCLGNLCARPTDDPDELVAQAEAMVGQERKGLSEGAAAWEYSGYVVDEGFKPEPRERFQYFMRVFRDDERIFRYCIWTSREAVEARWPGIDVTTEAGRHALEERLREQGHARVRAKIDAGEFENWLLDLRAGDEEEIILEERAE